MNLFPKKVTLDGTGGKHKDFNPSWGRGGGFGGDVTIQPMTVGGNALIIL